MTTLEEVLEAVERKHGRARRVWVFDRGIVSEENLQSLRRAGASYLVGTPRAQLYRRSIQNVPPMIESKCTTLGVLFSNWVWLFFARAKWLSAREPRFFSAEGC